MKSAVKYTIFFNLQPFIAHTVYVKHHARSIFNLHLTNKVSIKEAIYFNLAQCHKSSNWWKQDMNLDILNQSFIDFHYTVCE